MARKSQTQPQLSPEAQQAGVKLALGQAALLEAQAEMLKARAQEVALQNELFERWLQEADLSGFDVFSEEMMTRWGEDEPISVNQYLGLIHELAANSAQSMKLVEERLLSVEQALLRLEKALAPEAKTAVDVFLAQQGGSVADQATFDK